jgi:hypothetical protein
MNLDQAIFTSARSSNFEGYHLVAASEGVSDADRRALAVWGPSHGALRSEANESGSVNFFRLPGGDYCVSKTWHAGAEYSHRNGARVYTHCLIASAEIMARFSNNPFLVLRAAVAGGHMRALEQPSGCLETLCLPGRSPVVDAALLSELIVTPGAERVASLVQAVYEHPQVAVVADANAPQLIAGIISCLPPAERLHFSFSTGLEFSAQRPFRVFSVARGGAAQRELSRQCDATLWDVQQPHGSLYGWAKEVASFLRENAISELSECLASRDAMSGERVCQLNIGNCRSASEPGIHVGEDRAGLLMEDAAD